MMTNFRRTIAAAIVGVAIAGGAYGFLGSPMVSTADARLRDHPKLEAAHNALKDAKNYLEAATHNFHGHREHAVHAIDSALHQIRICSEEADRRDSPEPQPFADHAKLHHAKDEVKAARDYLFEAKHDFHGHKLEAIKALDETIHQINLCLED